MACMGPTLLFGFFEKKFLMDVHKNKLYVSSKETRFPEFIAIGISKHYHQLVEPFDLITLIFDAAGIYNFYNRRVSEQGRKAGLDFARSQASTIKYYAGKTDEHAT
ncbi:unnamed protein product, partial [Allacma fusca]